MKKVYIFELKKLLIMFLLLIVFGAIGDLLYTKNKTIYIDKDYLYALNIADRYMYAWIMRDGSIAYDLISENIKKGYTDLKNFQISFAGISNPHHQAYEIVGYRYLSKDRICFRVWYYEDYTGIYWLPFKRPKPSFLELIKVDKEKWLVDKTY